MRWSTGAQLTGAVNGTISPATGEITMLDGQQFSTLTFSVSVRCAQYEHGIS